MEVSDVGRGSMLRSAKEALSRHTMHSYRCLGRSNVGGDRSMLSMEDTKPKISLVCRCPLPHMGRSRKNWTVMGTAHGGKLVAADPSLQARFVSEHSSPLVRSSPSRLAQLCRANPALHCQALSKVLRSKVWAFFDLWLVSGDQHYLLRHEASKCYWCTIMTLKLLAMDM
ncbi:hypothetical protein L484_015806 [Morus notabilis]|uniref:Uncharacterized protein n=1 Tax=Morus notabilis TaxID=981085 RepID=W9RDM6_9ROSA|nr:hypothetical protein L484_015806 [Morus notabilis]